MRMMIHYESNACVCVYLCLIECICICIYFSYVRVKNLSAEGRVAIIIDYSMHCLLTWRPVLSWRGFTSCMDGGMRVRCADWCYDTGNKFKFQVSGCAHHFPLFSNIYFPSIFNHCIRCNCISSSQLDIKFSSSEFRPLLMHLYFSPLIFPLPRPPQAPPQPTQPLTYKPN